MNKMKLIFGGLVLSIGIIGLSSFIFNTDSETESKGNTACEVYGKVKIVTYGEDYKVKKVTYGEDLKVKWVTYGEDHKGLWKEVTYGEKFTIKWVDYGEDFTIKEVTYGEGC